MTYESVLDFWKKQNIKNANELASMLKSYSVNFAYHSGKIENYEIEYNDVREVFDKDGITSYIESTQTLFEIQNSKAAHERMLSAFDEKQIVDEEFLKKIQMVLTNGTYDERRYQIGEWQWGYKHHDYVTGKNEVGASVENVPKELDEFDGGVYPLTKLNKAFNDLGYFITNFAIGMENDWNRYFTWSVRRDIDKLRKKPNNQERKERIDYWNYMHFKYSMPYENQALFGLQKV